MEFMRAWQEARISLERLNEIHLRADEESMANKIQLIPEFGDLVLDRVSFRYPGANDQLILNRLSLRIPKGKTTAIVGSSGSGKTTLLKLLLNFYSPSEGVVRLGDVNLNSIEARLWRSQCGIVMQDSYLFNDSIARNIALGDNFINKQQLLMAVKMANIQTFIESLPLGYNTKIGAEGQELSQGQRQRLLLARLIYKNPDYIFFDEATSSLDSFNELVIMENLSDFFQGKTIIIVAHRLNTIKHADQIVVLDGGEIVEQGDHASLTYLRGAYYHLMRSQMELGA
jgi:ATP-binding cassette subfamily B protein